MRSKTKQLDKFENSFNSSDVEAYRDESPIPVVKEAYFEYQRNKRKAAMRRANSIKVGGEQEMEPVGRGSVVSQNLSEVELVIKE